MSIRDRFNAQATQQLLGIEVTEVEADRAVGHMPHSAALCFDADGTAVIHGGFIFTLADAVGAAAATAASAHTTVFTVDMRIDYLDSATDDLEAHASVVRSGGTVVVDVEVLQDAPVAIARGLYR